MRTPIKTSGHTNACRPFRLSLQRTRLNFSLHQHHVSRISQSIFAGLSSYSKQSNLSFSKGQMQTSHNFVDRDSLEIEDIIGQSLESQQYQESAHKNLRLIRFPDFTVQVHEIEKQIEQSYFQSDESAKKKEEQMEKETYFYKVPEQQISVYEKKFTTTKLKPGDYLKISQPLPATVVEEYNNKNAKDSMNNGVHFTQGYLKTIDQLYYIVENALFLHCPADCQPTDGSQNVSKIELSDICYALVETQCTLADLLTQQHPISNGQANNEETIVVACHPYSVCLYSVSNQWSKNGSQKYKKSFLHNLNMKYWLSECSQPLHWHVSGLKLSYIPDNAPTSVHQICLISGKTTKISVSPSANITGGASFANHNASTDIGFIGRVSENILYQVNRTWLDKLVSQLAAKVKVVDIKGCPCQTVLAAKLETSIRENLAGILKVAQTCRKKCVSRIYVKKGDQYVFDDIQHNEMEEEVLMIKVVGDCQIKCKCIIIVAIWNYLSKTISLREYQINQEPKIIAMSEVGKIYCQKLVFGHRGSYSTMVTTKKTCNWEETFVFTFVVPNYLVFIEVSVPNPTFSTPKNCQSAQISKGFSTLSRQWILSKTSVSYRTASVPSKQQWLYASKSGVITIATDMGYFRFHEIRTIDWLYSFLYNQISQNKKTTAPVISSILVSVFASQHLSSQFVHLIGCLMLLFVGTASIGNRNSEPTILRLKCGINLIQVKKIQYHVNSSSGSQNVRKLSFLVLQHLISHQLKSMFSCTKTDFVGFLEKLNKQIEGSEKNPFQSQSKQYKRLISQKACLLNKEVGFIKSHIVKTGFASTAIILISETWNLPIQSLTVDKANQLLEKICCLRQICEFLVQEGYQQFRHREGPKWEEVKSVILSPVSTVDHSDCEYSHSAPAQSHFQDFEIIWVDRITELIFCCQILSSTPNPNRSFGQLYKQFSRIHDPESQLSRDLFTVFAANYEAGLLTQWQKLIPSLVGATCTIQHSVYHIIESKSLQFWLMIFMEICGMRNKIKILKILSQQLKDCILVRQYDIHPMKDQPMTNMKGEYGKKTVYIPMFMSEYLHNEKGIRFSDLNLMAQGVLDLTSTCLDHPVTKSPKPKYEELGKEIQEFVAIENPKPNLKSQVKQQYCFGKIGVPPINITGASLEKVMKMKE